MPTKTQPFLKRSEVRKSRNSKSSRPDIQIGRKDAFQFLAKLEPGSVDLIVSSPPYCMGKEYDKSDSVEEFEHDHRKILPLLVRALKPGGSICWQVGHYVRNGEVVPLDALIYLIFSEHKELALRNRIVWTFGHGLHAKRRFSGRHETILWFTKLGKPYKFNLNAVRVPQKYPGKKHYKGSKSGQWSGNPKGKNPTDVWDIPNVKANHTEKTDHPCQFPVALVQRLVRAFTKLGDLVVDPFMGSGSSAVAAALEKRRFAGCDIQINYVEIAKSRIKDVRTGKPKFRPLERPIYQPTGEDSVSKRPSHFRTPRV